MAMSRSLNHVSYHDSGLQGLSGAMTVLRALSYNPFVTQLTLSHNQLGDEGVAALATGILDLRKRGRLIAPLRELNLSSNGLTDKGLDAIIRYILLPSAPPKSMIPTLHNLILSNNDIALSGSGATPHLLSTALSHPLSSLVSLSLTTNVKIAESPDNLRSFLRNLEPTGLVQLQLNACLLQPEDARTLAGWLADPAKGGKLAHLELNANAFGTDKFGTNRLAKVVYAGLNTSLLRLELTANERPVEELDPAEANPANTVSPSAGGAVAAVAGAEKARPEQVDMIIEGDAITFAQVRPLLADALTRNHILRESTRHAALQVFAAARVLLHAKQPSSSPEQIRAQVAGLGLEANSMEPSSTYRQSPKPVANYTTSPSSARRSSHSVTDISGPPRGSSPLLHLPPELVVQILRCLSALEPIPLPPSPKQAGLFQPHQPRVPVFASPLSNAQFAKIVHLAQDRMTLSGMTHRFDARHGAGLQRDPRDPSKVSIESPASFLRLVGCLEYERQGV